jgi:Zn-dependent oligopeptidase
MSGFSTASSWVLDVLRTKTFSPPNPILESLKVVAAADDANDESATTATKLAKLPQFSHMLPYHLEAAAKEVARQYSVDLAELEDSISSSSSSLSLPVILTALERIEAPLLQIHEVGNLFSQLAVSDELVQWQTSFEKAKSFLQESKQKESKIIYQAIEKQSSAAAAAATAAGRPVPPALLSILKDFRNRGVHLEDEEEHNQLQEIKSQLAEKSDRLINIPDFLDAKKAVRLQAVSDMYNVIGFSQQQAKLLGYEHVSAMKMDSNMATLDQVHAMNDEVAAFCAPHLVREEKLNAGIMSGGLLPAQNRVPTEEEKSLWEAHGSVKKLLTLDGVLKGLCDFSDAMLGIQVQEELGSVHGFHKDVRLFHLYDKDATTATEDDSPIYLGSFYMDAYKRHEKNDSSFTRLFTKRRNQTIAPLAIMALSIPPPVWDDNPTPLSWKDARALVYQFGKALQIILSQANAGKDQATIPPDVSEFMAYVSSDTVTRRSTCFSGKFCCTFLQLTL